MYLFLVFSDGGRDCVQREIPWATRESGESGKVIGERTSGEH